MVKGGGTTRNLPDRVRLRTASPFDHEGLLKFLAARAIPGVEEVEGAVYRRTVRLGGRAAWVEIAPATDGAILTLHLAQRPPRDGTGRARRPSQASPLEEAAARAAHLFDLAADPRAVAECLSRDPFLARRLARRPGVRVPGAWDPFELAVRAVLGQQISVAAARTLAGRLASRFGRRLETRRPGLTHVFPGAGELAAADLSAIGLPSARARTLHEVAERMRDGRLALLPGADLTETVDALVEVPGIGAWTASYIALRAGKHPDAFPSGDLGLRKALSTNGEVVSAAAAENRSRSWSPFRAYAALLLWMGES